MWRWGIGIWAVVVFVQAQSWEEAEEVVWEGAEEEGALLMRLEYFDYYRTQPLCLYRASIGELCRLPGITVSIARALRELLQRYPQLSYAELSDSIGLTPEQSWVLQRATTLQCQPLPEYSVQVRSSVTAPVATVVEGEGSVGGFFRSRGWGWARWQGMQLGIAVDKDAGEPGIVDFVSVSLVALPWRELRCIVGDFRLYTAMGLLTWGAEGWRYPSFEVSAPLQWRAELAPWVSTAEHGFLRGVGVCWEPQWQSFRGGLIGWISSAPRSGRIDTAGIVRSVVTDGIFATALQRALRGRFQERSAGAIAQLEWAGGRAAVGVMRLSYSHPLMTQSRQQFLGRAGTIVGGSVWWELPGGAAALECVRDAHGWWAWHGGIALRWEGIQLTWALRSLPDSFRTPYGRIVSRGAGTSNEVGMYLGLAWGRRGYRVQVYGDLFRTPAAPYGMPLPRYGTEVGVRWLWHPQRRWELWFHGTYRSWLEAEHSEEGWRIFERPLVRLRVDVLIGLNQRWRWRLRWDTRRNYAPAPVASAMLATTGVEGGEGPWQLRMRCGIYAVPTAALGFWIMEEVATRLPQLYFVTGYGSYGSLRIRWELQEDWALEVGLLYFHRRSPLPLRLWGAPVRGPMLAMASVTAEWRL